MRAWPAPLGCAPAAVLLCRQLLKVCKYFPNSSQLAFRRGAPVNGDPAALLGALARANAAEDALYELDAALADGRVGFDDFIRDGRRLARKQFFDKMRAAKIVAKRSPDRVVYRQSY